MHEIGKKLIEKKGFLDDARDHLSLAFSISAPHRPELCYSLHKTELRCPDGEIKPDYKMLVKLARFISSPVRIWGRRQRLPSAFSFLFYPA